LNNLNPDCQFSDSKHTCLKNHNHSTKQNGLTNRTRLTSHNSAGQTKNLPKNKNNLDSCGSSNTTSDSDSLILAKSATCPENLNKILLPTHILLQNSRSSGPASSSGVSSSKSGEGSISGEAVIKVDDGIMKIDNIENTSPSGSKIAALEIRKQRCESYDACGVQSCNVPDVDSRRSNSVVYSETPKSRINAKPSLMAKYLQETARRTQSEDVTRNNNPSGPSWWSGCGPLRRRPL
jgi:hypothetical protein